jgi:hypothetical protein
LSADLIFAYLLLNDIDKSLSISPISCLSHESPIHHVAKSNIAGLPSKSRLVSCDVETGKQEYGFIHGGYAFGARKGLNSTKYSPLDCSSFVKNYAINPQTPNWFEIGHSTLDLAYVYNWSDASSFAQPLKKWLESPDAILASKYQVIKNIDEIQPSDVWLIRENCDDKNPFGNSGHVGFIADNLGQGPDLEIVGLNREMPLMEGIGMEVVQKTSNSNQDGSINKIMYLTSIWRKRSHWLT